MSVENDAPELSRRIIRSRGLAKNLVDVSNDQILDFEDEIDIVIKNMDPKWFLTEETTKTRNLFLTLSIITIIFGFLNIESISSISYFKFDAVITNKKLLALMISFCAFSVGINYLLSAYSELAEKKYLWKFGSKQLVSIESRLSLLTKMKETESRKQIIKEAKEHQKQIKSLINQNKFILLIGTLIPIITFIVPFILISISIYINY